MDRYRAASYGKSLAVLVAVLAVIALPVGSASAATTTTMTLDEAHEALASGRVTSVQLTRAFLARIDKYEPFYNAFTAMNRKALAEARASDARRAMGQARSYVDGVPIVIKDSIDVAGLPTTGGWLSAQAGGINLVPDHDAPAVARLHRGGAIILGKTNLPAFSFAYNANDSWAGPTFNVLNRHWLPGGSSTGTATAVAADFATAGLGEETAGSIQVPAGAQSLVGIKPTFGLVPNTGAQPLGGPTRDVLGPITKTVSDAAEILNVISGYTLKDPKTVASVGNIPAGGYKSDLSTTALAGTRIGLYGPGWKKHGRLNPATTALYDKAIKVLEGQGATPVADPFAGSGFASLATAGLIGLKSMPYDFNNYLKNLGPGARVHSLKELDKALGVNIFDPGGPAHLFEELYPEMIPSVKHPAVPPDISSFVNAREKYLRIFDRVMDKNHLDALMFPQTTQALGKLWGESIDLTTVSAVNVAGLPLVVIPAGRYPSGKPFALVFVGRLWSEAQLIGYAYDYEQAAPGRIVRKHLATTPGPRHPKKK
ncbi:MAG: amidase [Actinobacteria bacterium]|nr:amidase [Actinomycetota bacterium]